MSMGILWRTSKKSPGPGIDALGGEHRAGHDRGQADECGERDFLFEEDGADGDGEGG